MRHIPYQAVIDTISQLCIQACYDLNPEMIAGFKRAQKSESHRPAVELIDQLLQNAEIAKNDRLPLCQDTGFTVVFVEQGSSCHLDLPTDNPSATIDDAINQGVQIGYEQGLLRKSIVAEPIQHRKNTNTNTPAVIHHSWVPGDQLKITVMAKGGGCENKSVFKMFKPTTDLTEIADFIVKTAKNTGADACPPFVIGIGIGGTFEKTCQLAKYALLRPLDSNHPDPFYADLEKQLLNRINKLNIGPAGLKGDTTALAVLIETFPCHIASLPVAINIECHSHRHKSITI